MVGMDFDAITKEEAIKVIKYSQTTQIEILKKKIAEHKQVIKALPRLQNHELEELLDTKFYKHNIV